MDSITKQITRHLHGIHTMQDIARNADLLNQIQQTKDWQKLHFIDSHAGFYQDKATNPSLCFIASLLFPQEKTQHISEDLKTLLPKAIKFLPKEAQAVICTAIELSAVSFELSFEITHKLRNTPIEIESYQQTFCHSNIVTLKQQQIELLAQFCRQLHYLTRIRGVNLLLSVYKKSALKRDIFYYHQLLQLGIKHFKLLPDPYLFNDQLIQKEQQAMVIKSQQLVEN